MYFFDHSLLDTFFEVLLCDNLKFFEKSTAAFVVKMFEKLPKVVSLLY
jgi:hypothetical protein